MPLWDWITGLIDKDRPRLLFFSLDPSHVLDEQLDPQAARQWDPAVHTLVRCNFANRTIELPNVVDSSRLGNPQSLGGGDVIANDLVLPV